MPGTPFPLPKNSTPGARPGEGEGRLMNCHYVKEGDRSYIRRDPGLQLLVFSGGATGMRGLLDVAGNRYIAYNNSAAYNIGTATATLTGALTGTDPVFFARNNRVTGGVSTPDVVAVRQSGGAFVLSTTTVSAYPDADLPSNVNSVAFLDGYLLFTCPDGRIFASELNSTAVNATSFATAEARPDGLKRVIVRGGLAYAMGESTIEIWKNVGTSPFPLQRSPTVLPIGLLSSIAVVGYEDTWNAPAFFCSSDYRVMALDGYETVAVSTPDVERFIAGSTPSSVEMTAYTWAGRSYVAISSNLGTWVYSVEARSWSERISQGLSRWRAKYSVYSAGSWVFGDAASGDLLVMSNTLVEVSNSISGFIQTSPLKDFPANIAAKLSADFTEADITVYVSWSLDGGKTWCANPLPRSLANADKWPIEVANLGRSTQAGLIVKFSWEGPADFSFMGATANRVQVGRV